MWTVVAVLAAWSIVSVAAGLLLGGVVATRRRDVDLEAGRVHLPGATGYRRAVPTPVA